MILSQLSDGHVRNGTCNDISSFISLVSPCSVENRSVKGSLFLDACTNGGIVADACNRMGVSLQILRFGYGLCDYLVSDLMK